MFYSGVIDVRTVASSEECSGIFLSCSRYIAKTALLFSLSDAS